MSNGRPSRFITFEGIDHSGKSTQAKQLKRSLDQEGIRCIVTAEPGGSGQLGVEIRRLMMDSNIKRDELTAALMFNADRHEHVRNIIKPTLANGTWVICDRFYDSTMAYQGAGGMVDSAILEQLTAIVCEGMKPDLTILMHNTLREQRGGGARLDYYEQEHKSFEQRVSDYFLEAAKRESDRFVVVEEAGTIERVGERIFAEVKKRFLTPDS
ncbi:MAG: dTMP kinase [Betaproteobacteria bacterium AqS2]|uniref:Thymidylate kinase n=1 Tax=Candidatus Amphirhobacter heronislandensis TaxID=1732024 RepID=A0A930UEN8_9GAMM|nr:dTMP kinase [Betaproteobacteria bacterium AqS2]